MKFKYGISLLVLMLLLAGCSGDELSGNSLNYLGSTVHISTITDSLKIQPQVVSTIVNNKLIQFSIDLSDSEVIYYRDELNNFEVTYINPDLITTTIRIHNKAVKSNNLDNQVITEIYPGVILEISQRIDSDTEANPKYFAVNLANTIRECLVESDIPNIKSKYIEIDGLGVYDLTNLDKSEYISTEYKDNILYIKNSNISFDISYVKLEDYEKYQDYNNIYKINEECFGIDTSKGDYKVVIHNGLEFEDLLNFIGAE